MIWNQSDLGISPQTDYGMEQSDAEVGDVRLIASRGQIEYVDRDDQAEPHNVYFMWEIIRKATGSNEAILLDFGSQDFREMQTVLGNLAKLQQQQLERRAGVILDATAMRVLEVLNQLTSVRWEELRTLIGVEWPDLCRGISVLSAADICEVGPLRLRLSEVGDRMLSKS